jgi:hypothetical protein
MLTFTTKTAVEGIFPVAACFISHVSPLSIVGLTEQQVSPIVVA